MLCAANKEDGSPCKAKCISGGEFCWFHDPDIHESRQEARVKGGKSKPTTLPPSTPDIPLNTVTNVMRALAETYNAVRTARMSVQVGNCLAMIAGTLMRAMEGSELERRIEELESERPIRRKRPA